MSRIGKLPIALPKGVEIKVDEKSNLVTVKGPLGELQQKVDPEIKVSVEDGQIHVQRPTDQKRHRSLHGLYRALINNMVKGVSEGFTVQQQLVGVAYKAESAGQLLTLSLGYSHNLVFELPKEISVETVSEKGKDPVIILKCIDKQLLGQVANKIRSYLAGGEAEAEDDTREGEGECAQPHRAKYGDQFFQHTTVFFGGAKLMKNGEVNEKCPYYFPLIDNDLRFLSKKISTYSFLLKKVVFLPPI